METALPGLGMLPVLFVAAVAATGATRTSERRRPRRSAAMLLVLQAVLLTTFLLFGAALHPTASRATLLGTTVIGTAGVATVACRSAVFRLVRRRLDQVYPVAALKAAWKPGRERSTMASLAVSEIRNHPGSSNAAPGNTYTSCSASRAANATSSAIGDRTTT